MKCEGNPFYEAPDVEIVEQMTETGFANSMLDEINSDGGENAVWDN